MATSATPATPATLPQRIRADLRDIALDLQALTDARAGWSRRGAPTGTTHHAPGPGTPSRAPTAAQLLDTATTDLWGIWRVALGDHDPPPDTTDRPWLLAVRLAGIPWSPHDHTAAHLVAELAGWLRRRAPAAVDVADVVTVGRCDCGTVLRAASDAVTADRVLTCERTAHDPQTGALVVTGCRRTWRARALRDHSLRQAGDHTGTATEIARAIGAVTPGRIRLWASEGRLPHRGEIIENGRRAPTYRISDVHDLIAERQRHADRRRRSA